jgi:hypothetical protein
VRRAEEDAVFGAEVVVVVEMGSETYSKRPAAGRGRSPAAPSAPTAAPATAKPAASAATPTAPATPIGPTEHTPRVGSGS